MLDYFKGTVTAKDWAFVGAILGATAVLCAAFYVLLYTRQQNKLADLKDEMKDIRSQLTDARYINEHIEELESESKKAVRLVELFEARLPDQREIPKLFRQFEALGGELGLSVGVELLPIVSDVNKETIPYKVTARGNFHQIVGFINLLEQDQRYLKISDLDIGEEEAGISEATFTLSTFRFKAKTEKERKTEARAAQ